jgi:hypothetical protein
MIAAFRPGKHKPPATSSSGIPIAAGDMLTLSAPRRMADRSHLRSREASSQLGRAQMTNLSVIAVTQLACANNWGLRRPSAPGSDHAC